VWNFKKLLDFSDKTVIITGGAGLLGRVYAVALLQTGAKVILFDKKIDKKKLLDKIKTESNIEQNKLNNLRVIKCDITNPKKVAEVFKKLDKSLHNLKILINNASLVKQVGNDNLLDDYKPFLKMKPQDWEEYFSVDLTGTLLVTQKTIPYMQKNGGGTIINISSTYGLLSPDQRLYKYFNKKLSTKEKKLGIKIEKPIGYSISKSGTLNLTRFLATKFAENNIRVNTMTLGGVYDNNPTEFVKSYAERTPLGRMANKTEYAGPLLFLASDMSSYMTGSNLIVDGGWTAW
tara:strand:- start:181 stop:1050 length:870 start_codon:yes stop_codon:yes gene_type:complete